MPHAIIIAFSYNNELPGAHADVKKMIEFCNFFNYTFNIITDNIIIHDKLFEEKIKDIFTTFTDASVLNEQKNNKWDGKLLIYYSGHGKNDSIVLSNDVLYSFKNFRNLIITTVNTVLNGVVLNSADVEIFWILDCCNPNGLHLPFKLMNNSFHFQTNSEFVCPKNFKILLITSSDNDEKSISTINGSLFTNELLLLLYSLHDNLQSFIKNYDNNDTIIPVATNRNLSRFINQLAANIRVIQHEYRQNVSIYSSYIIDPILWFWITQPTVQTLNIPTLNKSSSNLTQPSSTQPSSTLTQPSSTLTASVSSHSSLNALIF
jgi:hypothetical protein